MAQIIPNRSPIFLFLCLEIPRKIAYEQQIDRKEQKTNRKDEKQSRKTFIAVKNFLHTDCSHQHTRAAETNTSQLEHYRHVDANLQTQRTRSG